MSRYKVPVRFIFEGEYQVEAENAQQAKELVANNAWAILSTTGGDDEDIIDWDVDLYPDEMEVNSAEPL